MQTRSARGGTLIEAALLILLISAIAIPSITVMGLGFNRTVCRHLNGAPGDTVYDYWDEEGRHCYNATESERGPASELF